MPPPRGLAPARAAAVGCFIAIVAWLSVVIGIGVLDLLSRPWCSPSSPCASLFWPRLAISALGGIIGFLLCGYGLLNSRHKRPLIAYGVGGLLVAVASGIFFLPILNA